jgi:hypothetical protein
MTEELVEQWSLELTEAAAHKCAPGLFCTGLDG